MFGGNSNNPMNPFVPGESQFQYDKNAFPQLQLFGDHTVGSSINPLNNITKNDTTNRVSEAFMDPEPILMQQRHKNRSNNKLYQNDIGHPASILNPNPVSTGLKLSYEEDEHNSSISSVGEGMITAATALPPNNNVKVELDCQKQELEQYVRAQEENMMKGIRDLHRRQTTAFLSIVEKGLNKRLLEKDVIIENMNQKNLDLEQRMKQVMCDAQSWQYRAKYNECMLGVLKNNLQQVMAQNGKEGCGDSEVDDTASCSEPNHGDYINGLCRSCKVNEVCVLVLPCRHLCLCTDCESFVHVCPVCQMIKTASVEVYMS